MREENRHPTLADADEAESGAGHPNQPLRLKEQNRRSRASVPSSSAAMPSPFDGLSQLPDEEALTAELERDLALLREATARFEATKAWAEQDSEDGGFPTRREKIESSGGDAWLPSDLPNADIPMDNPTHGSKGRRSDTLGPRADQPSPMKDDNRNTQTAHLTTEQLEAELAKARAALKDLREKAAMQTRMYGSVGAQTRKLEQRAAELRDRVARAQQALHERAQKLQARLGEEREKLRAYQAKLKKKTEEINEAARERRRRNDAEIAALKAAFAEDRAALEKREAELDSRLKEIEEGAERELAEDKATLEETLLARQKELERRTQEIQRRLDRREAELSAREKEIAKNKETIDEILKARVEQIETGAQIDRSKQNEAFEATRQRLQEEAAAKEAELATLRESLVQHEDQVARQKSELARLKKQIEERARQMADGSGEMDRRDENLARMSAALEVRERRLQEWQKRIEAKESSLKASEETLDERRHTLENLQQQTRERLVELDAQAEEQARAQEVVDTKRRQLEDRDDETRRKLADIESRAAAIEDREADLEAQLSAVVDERKRYADLTERVQEVDRQKEIYTARLTELDGREQSLNERQAEFERDEAAFREAEESAESLQRDLDELSTTLNRREREVEERESSLNQLAAEQSELKARIDERESILNERRAKIEEAERAQQTQLDALREAELAKIEEFRRLETAKLEQQREADRAQLQEWQAAHAAESAQLQRDRQDLDRQRTTIDESLLALQMDRQAVRELQQAAEEEKATLDRDRAELDADRNRLAEERQDLQARRGEIDADRESLNAEQAALESDRARIERDRISLKDRERAVEEETTRLESLKSETEAARCEVQDLRDEAEALRDQLLAKADRLKSRKEQLVKDAAKVDTRLRELNEELAEARKERSDLRGEREKLAAEMAKMQRDREQFDRERGEMDQSRRTFQVGLKNLEDSQRDLADREVRLAERANELEAFRDRLEDEHADLQRQRKKLLTLQEASGDAKRNIEALMAQAEDREAESRRREETIKAHEQAMSLRAAELARTEDELRRDRRAFESTRAESTAEMEAIELARKEFEEVVQSQQTRLEEERSEFERELSAEREALAQRARELDEEAERRRAAIDAADDADVADMDGSHVHVNEQDVRRRIETEFEERAEEIRRKEEDFERRCKARIEGLDRDIEERLAELEHEIKERRERAEAEMKDRRRTQEEELREARNRLDDQVEDLRRRQAAITQEQSVLIARRRDVERDHREDEVDPDATDDAAGTILTIDDEIDANAAAADAPTEVVAEMATDASPFEVDATGDGPAGKPDAAKQESLAAAAEILHRTAMDGRPGRFRPVRTVMIAVAVGCLAAGAVLWSPRNDVEVRGLLAMNPTDAASSPSPQDHMARLAENDSDLQAKASQVAGIDLPQLTLDPNASLRLEPTDSGDAIRVTLRSREGQKAAAETWLKAWGAAYMDELSHSRVSAEMKAQAVTHKNAELGGLFDELKTAQSKLNVLENALRTDPKLSQVDAASKRKEQLKRDVTAANAELQSATAALEEFEKRLPPSGPVVPTDEQLANAYATDTELMLAMQQRDAKARDFHAVLLESMSQTQLPLATLLTTIEDLAADTERLIKDQADEAIRAELEEISLQLREYSDQAQDFSRSWDALAPKVAAWRAGGDAELLLEYQQKAELLIRDFHAASKKTMNAAGDKVGAIASGGEEMTKRRVVQSQLQAAVNASSEVRNEWIIAAQGVLPRYNKELLALQGAIEDLTPRIDELRRHHRERLAEHLLKAAQDDYAANLQALRTAKEEAARRHQKLSNEYVRVDEEATIPPELQAERRTKLAEISRQRETIEVIERRITSLQNEIERLGGTEEITMAGTATFKPLPPHSPGPFDFGKAQAAVGTGGGVGILYVLITWFALRPKRGRQ